MLPRQLAMHKRSSAQSPSPPYINSDFQAKPGQPADNFPLSREIAGGGGRYLRTEAAWELPAVELTRGDGEQATIMPLDLPHPLERVQIRLASLRGTQAHYSSAEDPSYQLSLVGAIRFPPKRWPGMLPAASFVATASTSGPAPGMMGRGMRSAW